MRFWATRPKRASIMNWPPQRPVTFRQGPMVTWYETGSQRDVSESVPKKSKPERSPLANMRATTCLYLQDDHCFEAEAIVVAIQEGSLAFDQMWGNACKPYLRSRQVLDHPH